MTGMAHLPVELIKLLPSGQELLSHSGLKGTKRAIRQTHGLQVKLVTKMNLGLRSTAQGQG